VAGHAAARLMVRFTVRQSLRCCVASSACPTSTTRHGSGAQRLRESLFAARNRTTAAAAAGGGDGGSDEEGGRTNGRGAFAAVEMASLD